MPKLGAILPALMIHGGHDEPDGDEAPMDHDGHEENGMHSACAAILSAIRDRDEEALCEALLAFDEAKDEAAKEEGGEGAEGGEAAEPESE